MSNEIQNYDGLIRYKELSIPWDGDTSFVARQLNFDETGKTWFLYKIPHFSGRTQRLFRDNHLEYYHPTYEQQVNFIREDFDGDSASQPDEAQKPRKPRVVNKSKTLDYVFVLSTQKQVNDFSKIYDLNPIYCHRVPGEILKSIWTTIPKTQMHYLMLIVEGYEKEVQFMTPTEQMLSKGDRVRVVAGRFRGVEGTLITNQGQRSGGEVYVQLVGNRGMKTARVPDEHLQVIEFSRQSNHFACKMAAYEKVLLDAFSLRARHDALPVRMCAEMEFFLFRYANLSGMTLVHEARLVALRCATLVMLKRSGEAQQVLGSFMEKVNGDSNLVKAWRRYPTASNCVREWTDRVEEVLGVRLTFEGES